MDHFTVCMIAIATALTGLIVGFVYGYFEGKKGRLADKRFGRIGRYEFVSSLPDSVKSEVIKGHDVLVELGGDSNYTRQRISIDGISTGVDLRTFVTDNLRCVIAAHLISVYDRSLSITTKSKLEAIGLTKADVPQIVVEGVLYRITFVKGIKPPSGEYAS